MSSGMSSGPVRIPRLLSGGLIVTYRCTSRCRHCLYASSPRRENRYIDDTAARAALETVRRLGCSSLHVGGGEPFLDPDGLLAVARAAREEGVAIEYVETNSSWYRDAAGAGDLLVRLRDAGVSTLLISISPFHTEYVPFARVRGLIEACGSAGVSIFPWVESFMPDVSALDESATHPIDEHGGDAYLRSLPERYWIHLGGRAVLSFRDVMPLVPPDQLPGAGSGCRELTDTSHFHVDLDGRYVPGLCSGLGISLEDLASPLDPGRYPLISLLAAEGAAGLLSWARQTQGFSPKPAYLNKCDLCLDIRRHLAAVVTSPMPELGPADFYKELSQGAF